MKRRSFIKKTGIGVVGTAYLPLFLSAADGLGVDHPFKRLIVIQLSGGNDGLNTIIPYENDIYHLARPKIRITNNEVIKLNDQLGFTPHFSKLSEFFKEGKMSVINSVGYPNPNRSHFRSMDIWQSASDSDKYLKSGWVGRYLDAYCQQDHRALEIDNQLSLALEGNKLSGIALQNPQAFNRALKGKYLDHLSSSTQNSELDEDNLGYLYKTFIHASQSARYLKNGHRIRNNNYDFPKSNLGRKLATVSQFIRSELSTEIYYVSQNGYDSHSNQLNQQKRLHSEYSDAVYALIKSLQKSGHFKDTLIFTFSEFGRRVAENGSRGTDHGKANSVWVIGDDLRKPGFYNNGPDLANLDDGDVSYKIDFRNIYADIIQDWLQKDPAQIMNNQFDSLNII